MKCPSCKTASLTPSELASGLPCTGCKSCGGVLVSLVAYRHWHERFRHADDEHPPEPAELVSDTKGALLCPKCQRLMIKYKYTKDRRNNLDLCTHCDEFWLDAGEWDTLRALDLTGKLPAVFTEPWQRALREARSVEAQTELWRRRLGDDYDRAAEFRAWLAGHPQRGTILNFLDDE